MTHTETYLWSQLQIRQQNGHAFYKQKIPGTSIVDFYCPSAKLVIEVANNPAYSNQSTLSDLDRKLFFHRFGISVLCFSDIEVLENIEGVIQIIDNFLESR